ncbi:MAG: ATP-binding cassette domain-containing protein [Nitrososphaerota archaeon]
MATIELQCTDVTKKFGSLRALDGVTFKLSGCKIKGLIGPNGSGKTVLLNTLTKVPYGPDGGKIVFNGKRIDRLKPSQICKLGIARTFQTLTFFPSLTVEQNLLVGVKSLGKSRTIVSEALYLTGLLGKEKYKAASLSFFDLKMLMIATALSIDPKLLLLDEPLGGISEDECTQMLSVIKNINETGRAILIVEHKINEIVNLCDEMIVLHMGKVIADGEPEKVISQENVLTAYFGGKYNA